MPGAKRFAVWTPRYLMVLVGAEAFIGGVAVLLTVAAVGAPIAIALSLSARLLARKLLNRLQHLGGHLRHVVVAESSAAAQQLTERIQRVPRGGMKVIGLVLPSEQLRGKPHRPCWPGA